MHEHHIKEMTKRVLEVSNQLFDTSEQEVDDALKSYWDDKIASVWTITDVMCRADELELCFNDQEAKEILDTVLMRLDACVGINWEVLGTYIEDFDREREDATI